MKRNRGVYLLVLILVIVMGLGTRRSGGVLPRIIAEYGGDTLWALMVYVGLGFLSRTWPVGRLAFMTVLISFAVEFSQLIRIPWLDALRHTTPGALILGQGFLWSDLLCYTVGTVFGVTAELLWLLTFGVTRSRYDGSEHRDA